MTRAEQHERRHRCGGYGQAEPRRRLYGHDARHRAHLVRVGVRAWVRVRVRVRAGVGVRVRAGVRVRVRVRVRAHLRGGGKHADTHEARALGRSRASARVGSG